MDWRLAIEEEVAVLKRIVALLFSLAGLAECSAGQSPAVRALVLWLLRHAESAARGLVVGEQDMSLASPPVAPADASPAEAMRLAASLRALAMQIELQARLVATAPRAQRGDTDPLASGAAQALHSLAALAAFALPMPQLAHVPDTS